MLPYRSRFLQFVLLCLLSGPALAQTYTVYDSFPQLEARIQQAGNTTLVINFWATWCAPCVAELPHFETLRKNYHDNNVEVLLVSLDFKSQLKKRFIPFLEKNNLLSEVILFADQDANAWIPRIHEAWDGAIPATLVVRGKTKSFFHGKFDSYEDLENFVSPFVGTTYAPGLTTTIVKEPTGKR
jgi:thiol-disulfide isomerase/thioredoxin